MKAFWNKICRIFGINRNAMETPTLNKKDDFKDIENISLISAVKGVLSAIFSSESKPLISDSVAEIINDKEKAKKFNEFLDDPNTREFTENTSKGTITYKK